MYAPRATHQNPGHFVLLHGVQIYTLVLGYVPFPCGEGAVFVLVTTMAIGVVQILVYYIQSSRVDLQDSEDLLRVFHPPVICRHTATTCDVSMAM